MNAIKIGVDVGNYDTKTQNCTIASGYKRYDTKPEIATKILEYNGSYYVPDISERMPYVADKTQNDQCLILTLFGIAEELIYTAKKAIKDGETATDSVQAEIDKYKHIKLGIGLPPGHFSSLSHKTLDYYNERLSGEINISYKKYRFSFVIDTTRVYPQDFVAVFKNKESEIAKKKRYYIVGIGGGTVDVIPVINGDPDVNNCFSLESGTRVMYRKICADVQRSYGEMLDESLVEDVLRNEETILDDNIKALIKENAEKHYADIINGCIQQGVKLSLYPVVFFGGGALLLKEYITSDKKMKNPEIIADTHANAKAYASCLN